MPSGKETITNWDGKKEKITITNIVCLMNSKNKNDCYVMGLNKRGLISAGPLTREEAKLLAKKHKIQLQYKKNKKK